MSTRRIAVPLAVVAALAPAAGAHARDVVRPTSVPGTLTVEAGSKRSLALACPPGAVALNAVITSLADKVEVRRSLPGQGGRRWRFTLAAATDGGGRVSAVLRCLHLDLPRGTGPVRLEVQTRLEPGITVEPGATRRVELRCAPGFEPTGYGAGGPVGFRAAQPTRRGWVFRLSNPTGEATRVAMRVRCLQRKVVSRRTGEALSFDLFRTRRCGARAFTVAAAFDVTAARGGRNLLCLARGSTFR